MSSYDNESVVIIAVLMALICVYLYLMFGPDQRHLVPLNKHVVIQLDSAEKVKQVLDEVRGYGSGYSGGGFDRRGMVDDYWKNRTYEWGKGKKEDDFFLEGYNGLAGQEFEEKPPDPLVPSDKYDCGEYWITARAEINYRYLWMHGTEDFQMGASATVDTPAHRKSFKLHPISNCDEEGWVLLQDGDDKSFIQMLSVNKSISLYNTDKYAYNIKLGTQDKNIALADLSYHFLLESEGYIVSRDCLACVNIMTSNAYVASGHSAGWYTHYPAQREFSAIMQFSKINESEITESRVKEEQEAVEIAKQDEEYVHKIASFPPFPANEKHVISFGLYGAKPKYTTGALKNLQLAKVYFPGWVCRFYVTSDVPSTVLTQIKQGGGEVVSIPDGKGYTSGMFWRFLVADDPAVSRYIIRDSDSRLNARDRIAVEEWIRSGYPFHIMRDHVNHCIVMNGGMWGGVHGALGVAGGMQKLVEDWDARNEYMADLHFLEERIWPIVKHKQIAHDSYCCDRYPHTRPYPTKRYMDYQHVGQVFDELDRPRLTDIDGFIRGVPVPSSCRKQPDWIYG